MSLRDILHYAVYEVFLVLVSLNKIIYINNFSNAFTNILANLFLSTVTQFYFTRWILYLTIKLPNRVKRGLADEDNSFVVLELTYGTGNTISFVVQSSHTVGVFSLFRLV